MVLADRPTLAEVPLADLSFQVGLAAMGICRDGVASSFERFDASQRRQVGDILASLGIAAR